MRVEDVARLWDANAERWTEDVRAGFDVFRDAYNNPAFFAFVGPVAGLDVLDAGCGEGTNTRLFARAGARMVGVDLSAAMIERARATEQAEPLGIRYAVGSFTELSGIEDAAHDLVVSTMALMDSPDLDAALAAFARVLRPGGRLCFSVTHPCFTNAAMGFGEEDGVSFLRVRAYAVESPVVETWKFGAAPEGTPPFRIAYFPRTLSTLVHAVLGAGFRLDGLAEPCPTEEACRAHPRLARYRTIPHFLYLGARKP